MPFSAPMRFEIECTTDGSGNVSKTFDPGRGCFLFTGAFFDEGSAGGFTTATIKDQYGMDLLNNLGASAVTVDTIYSWSDLGGGLIFCGPITITMTGAGSNGNTSHWRLSVVGTGS